MKPAPEWLVWFLIGFVLIAPHIPLGVAAAMNIVCLGIATFLYWKERP